MSTAGYIEREPNPAHEPRKGDQYISRSFGVTITVVAVGNKGGRRWVVWAPVTGVKYKTEYEKFKNESRRVLKRKPAKGRRR